METVTVFLAELVAFLIFVWLIIGILLGLFEAVDTPPLSQRVAPKKRVFYWFLFGVSGLFISSTVKSIMWFFKWLER